MTRAIVLLLALPTLLMPPGMCACRVASLAKAPVTSGLRQPAATHDAAPRPSCSCDSCRARMAADLPIEHPLPADPSDHCPGCPAAVGAVPLNVPLPDVAEPLELAAVVRQFTSVVEPAAVPARGFTSVRPAASPPLFIAHCSLLI